jgi:hypothetical protein
MRSVERRGIEKSRVNKEKEKQMATNSEQNGLRGRRGDTREGIPE